MKGRAAIKKCNTCNEVKELINFYSQNKKKASGEKYIYYQPECKECAIKRSQNRYNNDVESGREYSRKWARENKERHKAMKQEWDLNNEEYVKGLRSLWRKENTDKLKVYGIERRMNKKHDITDTEWFDCIDYFNGGCAYCGLSESDQYELYNEQFHKEHVFHDGSNYIDNCVPSCKSCNTSKHMSDFSEWYNIGNPSFSQSRYERIVKWMTVDCFKTLNII